MTYACIRTVILSLVTAQFTLVAYGDIYYYAVAKSIGYTQTSNLPPAGPDAWLFTASLDYTLADEVLSATITFDVPPPVTVDMYRAGETAQRYYSVFFFSEPELDAAYPSATYTFTADRGAGPETADAFLPPALYPPEIPYFTVDTYERLQGMDPAELFEGAVNVFLPTAGTTYGATYVTVAEDSVGGILTVALAPSDSAFQIPAGLLLPDTNYSIGVQHLNGVETVAAGFDDASSFAEFSRGTILYFRTRSDAPPCAGDVDGDLDVDLTDLAILLAHFGTPAGATTADGDLDADGDVDLTDLALLLANFGTTC
ncbi:MAG: hypothetical protein HZB38_02800 [Planctomycetes bacterium]|nr:hypothetical protein [Planctomycetota bacterium]